MSNYNYFTVANAIDDNVQKLCEIILEKLDELGVTEFDFSNYWRDIDYDDIRDIKTGRIIRRNIVNLVYDYPRFADCSVLSDVFHFELSDGEELRIKDIPLWKLYCVLTALSAIDEEILKRKRETICRKGIHVENQDIIITDPCYIIKQSKDELVDKKYEYPNEEDYDLVKINGWTWKELTPRQFLDAYRKHKEYNDEYDRIKDLEYSKQDNDWRKCEYGQKMSNLGINTYLMRDTIDGDWSCTTFNTDTGNAIGEFCADTGMVGVFLLDEVLAYNPEFDYHENRKWTTTLIKNFTGDIYIEVRHNEEVEDTVHVVGKGNINFETRQSGL